MLPFELHLSTKIKFGCGVISATGDAIRNIGKRPLVITGIRSAQRFGYLETVLSSIKRAGMEPHVFQGVGENPEFAMADAAGKFCVEKGCDFVIGLGGGSCIDVSKMAAVVARNPNSSCWEYTAGHAEQIRVESSMPIVAIPTTAGPGSECSNFAVLSARALRAKSTIMSDFIKPIVAILDPSTTRTCAWPTTVDGCSDILSHVLEFYVGTKASATCVTDHYCKAIVRSVLEIGPQLRDNPEDLVLRSNLMWAASLALNGLQRAGRSGCGVPLHNLEHGLSAIQPSLSHGRGLGILYVPFYAWLIRNGRATDRLSSLSELFPNTENNALAFVESLRRWLDAMGIPDGLSTIGFNKQMVQKAAEYSINTFGKNGIIDACGNLTLIDAIEILEHSL
jgi:alcohol dehydrogenase YqhD (iron-dependent ADH family)